MWKRLLAAMVLAGFSLGLLLLPWPGNYASPLLWAEKGTESDRPVDVFLVGATSDLGQDGTFQSTPYLPTDRYWQSELLNLQRGLYEADCRIYAPYYRQVCLSAYYLSDVERGPYFAVAYEDVREAFSWYLSQENQGRPLILAGYSQGADMALRLLEEFGEAISSQLVAAYLIGWRVTEEDLTEYPFLRMAQGETDTGVIISFNTEADFVADSIIVPQGGYTYGINPLNWKTDDTLATAEENPGSCFLHMDGSISQEIPALTGCYRSPERGTLIVTDISPEDYPPGEPLFVAGCYHNYELQFYYRSVQKNVHTRIEAFLSTQ